MFALMNANTANAGSASSMADGNNDTSPPHLSANALHLKQKRNRSQLSCTPCRVGKLKCNRAHNPACDQCTKRNRENQCVYPPPPQKQKQAQNVKGRIRQLESLVVDLMNQNKNAQQQPTSKQGSSPSAKPTAPHNNGGQFSEPTPPSDDDGSPSFSASAGGVGTSPSDGSDSTSPLFGQMKISGSEIAYVGEAHWDAILNSISELKRELADDNEDDAPRTETSLTYASESTLNGWKSVPMGGVQPHPTSGLGFVLGDGQTRPVSRQDLISSVPEKKITDRLLSLWFNSSDPFKPIIHAPAFQDEYRRFWSNPNDTPTMWLGLLHSILALASSFGLRDVDAASANAQSVLAEVNKFHGLAAGAAVLGDFTKPKAHTLECLILYAAGLRSNNAFVNVWLMIGLVLRLALRMGYHRDPSHYPAITPFQGEMRRRVWAILSMIDVLISFQLGLPSMIKSIQTDTQSPRNILDRDFNPASKALPPNRSFEELTPCSYVRAKLALIKVFAEAAELSHATVPPTYQELMDLDQKLEEAEASVPPLLQMPDISELVTDPAEQLMCRFNLDLLYLKTKMTLHRRFMLTPFSQLTAEEQASGIGTSRKICIECALRVLKHHHEIYQASQSGGQLESVKWYMGSVSTHDFLLAAMIICLELSNQVTDDQWSDIPGEVNCPKRRALVDALDKSQKIWSSSAASNKMQGAGQFVGSTDNRKGAHMFNETDKAARAMAVMLEKTRKQFGTRVSDGLYPRGSTGGPPPMPNYQSSSSSEASTNTPWSTASGDLSSFGMTGGRTNLFSPQSAGANLTPQEDTRMDFPVISGMLDVNADLDWESWDKQFQYTEQMGPTWDNSADMSLEPNAMDFGIYGTALSINPTASEMAMGGSYLPVPGNALFPAGLSPLPAGQALPGHNSQGLDFPSGLEVEMSLVDYAMNYPNGGNDDGGIA